LKKAEKTSREASDVPASMTLKDRVWKLLDKHPTLRAKKICQLLHLNYNDKKKSVTNIRSDWFHSPRFERGSKPSSSHRYHGWVYVPKCLNRREDPKVTDRAVECGWIQTMSKNRYLLWKDPLGHMKWYETGRVNINLRKPANNKGKALQLVANGFYGNGMIFDIRHFEAMAKTYGFKGQHYVYDTKQELPYMIIKDFQDVGFVIKIGDLTHKCAVEIIYEFPDHAERSEKLQKRTNKVLEDFATTMERVFTPKPKLKKGDSYIR